MHAWWRSGDVERLDTGMRADMAAKSPQSYKLLDVDRNNAWLPQIEKRLTGSTSNDTLVVVGALHLLGADGLVEKLKAKGYTVERVCDSCAEPAPTDVLELDSALLSELAGSHVVIENAVNDRALISVSSLKMTGSNSSVSLSSYTGSHCKGTFRTIDKVVNVDWSSVARITYGTTMEGSPMVAVDLLGKPSAGSYQFTAASEIASRESAQKMNLIRAACVPLQ